MASVTLRTTEFDARVAALGLPTRPSAQARLIDVAPSIHHRVLKGERPLNAHYALSLLLLVGSDEVRREVRALFGLGEQVSS